MLNIFGEIRRDLTTENGMESDGVWIDLIISIYLNFLSFAGIYS